MAESQEKNTVVSEGLNSSFMLLHQMHQQQVVVQQFNSAATIQYVG